MAEMEKIDSLESIKEALIKSCITSRPDYFKPYLFSGNVSCEPDKPKFYIFFKYMVAVSKRTSEGELFLKVVLPNLPDKQVQHYEFYDHIHVHPRLTVILEESNDSLILDLRPF